MLQQQVYIINTFLMAMDAVCIILAGYGAMYLKRWLAGGDWLMEESVFVTSVLVVMFVNNYIMGRLNLYSDRRPASALGLLWSVLRSVLLVFALLSTGIFLLKQDTYSREFLLLFAGISFLLLAITRLAARAYIGHLSSQSFNARKILVVGDMERGKIVSDLLARQLSWGHQVVGRLVTCETQQGSSDSLGHISDLSKVLQQYPVDEIIFAVDGDRTVNIAEYLAYCKKIGLPARILPALWAPGDQVLSVERCQGVPFLTIQGGGNFNAAGLMYKRLLDIFGGLVGTSFLLLMYPFVALAIKLDSPGPVFFKQKRVGQNGRIFQLYKFRSMYQDAEERKKELMAKNEMKGAMFKLQNDPRITKVGRWLRKTSLDEFPQFLNVLKGEMSLVGTRPPTVEEVQHYQLGHRRRISAKPGITGLWQVSGRNRINDFEKVVELDCQYLDNWRFLDDLKIIGLTVIHVLQRKGAF